MERGRLLLFFFPLLYGAGILELLLNLAYMLGFELTIKGETISTALNCGRVIIAATQTVIEQVISFDLSVIGSDATDLQETKKIIWYRANLQEGDEFTVSVKEICENSVPLESERCPSDNEEKLKLYNSLKKELEIEGLL